MWVGWLASSIAMRGAMVLVLVQPGERGALILACVDKNWVGGCKISKCYMVVASRGLC